jgi:hypothetical protein
MIKMKSVLLAPVILMASGAAFADQPGPDWMTIEQLQQTLRSAGYHDISKLEADDGHWEGKGVKNGTVMEFHVDPHTGAFTKEKPDD